MLTVMNAIVDPKVTRPIAMTTSIIFRLKREGFISTSSLMQARYYSGNGLGPR